MTNSPVILHLVDSIEYVENNCFQHQLTKALQKIPGVRTVALSELASLPYTYDRVVCCLKQRTLFKYAERLTEWIGPCPVVVYDQDPWQAYMDDSPFKGTYELARKHLNITSFALTTQLWADFLFHRNVPSMFVRMSVLPEYCDVGPKFEERSIPLGFIGTIHPHRKKLFDELDEMEIQVNVQMGNTLDYQRYLKALSNIRVFIHSEDSSIQVDGEEMNLRDGLWIKDVEAASRGCFSVRNAAGGYLSYFDEFPQVDGHRMVRMYKRVSDIPRILADIERMDPQMRQDLIHRTVDYIKRSDRWQETALALTTCKF